MARLQPQSGCAEPPSRLVGQTGDTSGQWSLTALARGITALMLLIGLPAGEGGAREAQTAPAANAADTVHAHRNFNLARSADSGVMVIDKTTPGKKADSASSASVSATDTETKAALTPGPPIDPATGDDAGQKLYLEVFINGNPTNLIAEFAQTGEGQFASTAKELDELGIRVPEGSKPDDLIELSSLGASAHYDEDAQRLDIRLPPERLKRNVYDLAGKREMPQPSPGGTGFVLNYGLFASGRSDARFTHAAFNGASAHLEGWVYSPLGTVLSAVVARSGQGGGPPQAIRLQSHWTYVDVKRAVRYQVGDVISAGPSWARPMRLGGVQVTRNFRLRPDIIATPLPSISGTAAVPTVIDVYVNNLKVHSREVPAGPFEIANIPALSQGGVARLVMHDASGREIVRERRFYVSPRLLRKDLMEFSFSAGVPRNNFGTKSLDYDWRWPVATGSVRYGLSDKLTLHAHAQAARDLALIGGGATGLLFDRVLLQAAGAVSHSRLGTGFLSQLTLETRLWGLAINASSLRTHGDFADAATIAALRIHAAAGDSVLAGTHMPRALESLNLGYAFPDLGGSVSLGLVHARSRDGTTTNNLNIGYNQGLFGKASLYVTALIDLDHPREPGIFAGLSMPLGGDASASLGVSHDANGHVRTTASYDKPLKMKDGSVGWRARVTYGDLKSVEASLAWRSPVATFRGTAMRIGKGTLAQASVDGAIVVADGALFAANRITDAFAIVNAGARGVRVRHENRVVGRTRRDGRLLVTSLRSLERNKISIDPETLPADAIIDDDKTFVVPGVRAGVVVNFKTRRTTQAALVILHDARGKPLPAGSEVRLQGAKETFIVGYDGETFLDGLKAHNVVEADTGGKTCTARFDFTPGKEVQAVIGPVVCR